MIGGSNLFRYGELYISEIKRLMENGSLDALEAAALLAQMAGLCELRGNVAHSQHGPNGLLTMLPHLVSPKEIESMIAGGISPSVVSAARKRRYGTYCRVRRAAQEEILSDSQDMCSAYARAREWPSYIREERRRLMARILFADLAWAGWKFRWGFRADIGRLAARLGALALDLPHRRNCLA